MAKKSFINVILIIQDKSHLFSFSLFELFFMTFQQNNSEYKAILNPRFKMGKCHSVCTVNEIVT